MEVEMKVEGLKELMEQLDTFCSPGVQQKLVQNALKEGIKPVKDEAERRLGKGPGYVKAFKPKKKYWRTGAVANIALGIASKHWPVWFQESGTAERTTKKGARRGKITAKPFAAPALESQKEPALDRMRKYLSLALEAIIEHKRKDVPDVGEVK